MLASMIEQNRQISEVIAEERSRLRNFIRKRVPNEADVEELLQEVFYELVEANRLLMPIDYVTGWLFSVARNRITDLFRKKRPENFTDAAVDGRRRRAAADRRSAAIARCRTGGSLPAQPAAGRTGIRAR